MEWFADLLKHYPELAIFLTLAFGFWIGKFKIGKFSLGTVTSVLLVGVLIGQLHIDIGAPIKSVFFLIIPLFSRFATFLGIILRLFPILPPKNYLFFTG